MALLISLCGAVVAAAVIEWMWSGVTLPLIDGLVMVVMLLAVVTALAPQDRPHLTKQALLWGIAAAILAAVGQGAAGVATRTGHELASTEVGAFAGSWLRVVGGFVIVVPLALLTKAPQTSAAYDQRSERSAQQADKTNQAWPWLAASVILGPVVGIAALHEAFRETLLAWCRRY